MENNNSTRWERGREREREWSGIISRSWCVFGRFADNLLYVWILRAMCLFVDCSVATDQDFHLSLSHYDYYFKILSLHIYIDCMLCVMVYTDTATASFYAILCDHFILAHPYNVCSFTLRKHLFICARDTFSKRIFATQTRVSKRPSNQPANRANAVEDKSCNSVKLLNYHEPMMFICVYAFAHAHWVCVCVCACASEWVRAFGHITRNCVANIN